jgi:hypothetical protein
MADSWKARNDRAERDEPFDAGRSFCFAAAKMVGWFAVAVVRGWSLE